MVEVPDVAGIGEDAAVRGGDDDRSPEQADESRGHFGKPSALHHDLEQGAQRVGDAQALQRRGPRCWQPSRAGPGWLADVAIRGR